MFCLLWSLWLWSELPAWSCQSPWHARTGGRDAHARSEKSSALNTSEGGWPDVIFLSCLTSLLFILSSLPSQHVCLSVSPPDLLLSILQWSLSLSLPPFFVFFSVFSSSVTPVLFLSAILCVNCKVCFFSLFPGPRWSIHHVDSSLAPWTTLWVSVFYWIKQVHDYPSPSLTPSPSPRTSST